MGFTARVVVSKTSLSIRALRQAVTTSILINLSQPMMLERSQT